MNSLQRIIANTFGIPTLPGIKVGTEGSDFFYYMQGTTFEYPFNLVFESYRNIPHLAAVINKKAQFFSNLRFKIVKTNTDEYEVDTEHALNEILENPNAFQSWQQMLYMIEIYKSIAGVCFMLPGFGLTAKPSNLAYLKVIDFDTYMQADNYTTNVLMTNDIDELIRSYTFFMKQGQSVEMKPSELIQFKDTNISYTQDYSRITSLKENLANIYKSLVARGILIDKKGGVGLISGNQRTGQIPVPIKPKEKEKLEKSLESYGLGHNKNPIILTDVPLQWTPMVFPTSSLMLFEEIEDDFFTICDRYGMARELWANNQTYENKNMAEADTYQNTTVPDWKAFLSILNRKLNTKKENIRIEPDFSHIGVLTEDEAQAITNENNKSQRLIAELDKGIITIEEYRQQMGYEA